MSLVRFSHTETPITDLRNKISHIYDLHQLLKQHDINAFFDSGEFDEMLQNAAQDEEISSEIIKTGYIIPQYMP